MKLSKRLILKVAYDVYEQYGEFTQHDIHEKIEQHLGRTLTISEKRRITQILRREFVAVKTERDRTNYRIYIYFIL